MRLRRFACLLACLPALLLAASQASPLAARIDAHIGAERFAGASWGIQAVAVDGGRVLYEHDPRRLLVPASVAKLYTAAVALDTLGAEHRAATSLLATRKPARDGTLHGDLILYGYGDPTLGTQLHAGWADALADAAVKAGLRKVEGDLIADTTYFAAPEFGSGWEASDLQTWFGAPVSALDIGENVARVFVRPGARVGQVARLRFEPEVFGRAFDLVNTLATVAASSHNDVNLIRRPGERSLHAFGRIALGTPEAGYRLALPDPPQMAAWILAKALGERGIGIEGKLRVVAWPETRSARAREPWHIADTWSPPLASVLEQGLKRSQNLYLQALLLQVGAQEAEQRRVAALAKDTLPPFRSTDQLGLIALRRYLAGLGITPDEAVLTDGAGLSRRNLTSAAALVKLLVALADDPAARPFRTALPVSGVDGTLAGRLAGKATREQVFAKSGAMQGVAALAGYATTASGERIAFAILLDNYRRPPGAARASAEIDAIVAMLVGVSAAPGKD